MLIRSLMRIALACLLVGCAANPAPVGDVDVDAEEDVDVDVEPTPEPELTASGAFKVRSDIDLTVEAVLPQTAADYVGTLRDFHANPAKTLFDLAEDAGVPAVQDIRDALPAYVEDKLEGWINGEIAKLTINGVSVTQLAGNVVALAETALTHFALESELVITEGSSTHTLTALDLTPAGLDAVYALDALPADVIAASPTCSSEDQTLSIGDHGYAIPYGEYMWKAIDASFIASYGMDIRATLGAAVNCSALAGVIANKCYWGYCVGHQAELTAICERGLDEAVERAQAKVEEMRFDAVHFAAGTATLVDDNGDGVVEALASGVWTAEINAGMGLRHVPATFTATK